MPQGDMFLYLSWQVKNYCSNSLNIFSHQFCLGILFLMISNTNVLKVSGVIYVALSHRHKHDHIFPDSVTVPHSLHTRFLSKLSCFNKCVASVYLFLIIFTATCSFFLLNIYQSAVVKNAHGVPAFVIDLFSVRIGQNFYCLHLEAFNFFFTWLGQQEWLLWNRACF
jgi:hypothetical protein